MECFTVYSDKIEGRIDPYFYMPEFVELEEKVAKKTNKKLGDFIISISSGATPSRKKDEELYTDEKNGIPFLRVQNITENGLVLDDVKFITKEVHNTELKRSQVKEDNLLITITGRIASSCIVPKGFEGNINQHSVVIETKDRETAEIIATFLNSKTGNTLALRRTSGGSRPALDYSALKSIPVILNEKIVSLMDNAYQQKKQKEQEAQKLLDSINDFVLDELGIKLPELEDKKCFVVNSEIVNNNRLASYYYQPKYAVVEQALNRGKYKTEFLKKFIIKIHYGVSIKNEYIDEGIPLLRILNLKPNMFNLSDVVKLDESKRKEIGNGFVYEGDILISRSGSVGIVAVVPKEADGFAFGSFMIKFCVNDEINKEYLSIWLNNQISKLLTEREKIGAIQGNITIETIENFKIPIPPLEIQNKIAEEVKNRQAKAKQLQEESKQILDQAKQEVEKMILEKK
ncbi:MAG: restriction endonuclease subunit S [Elusimicrobia bacterium]|nr:restriction endonuclease subunit S [Elusimicrobiota bacterium]